MNPVHTGCASAFCHCDLLEITDSDLRQLAERRAQNVKELMLQSENTADRIFIVESKTLTPEKKEKVKDSRADFKLK